MKKRPQWKRFAVFSLAVAVIAVPVPSAATLDVKDLDVVDVIGRLLALDPPAPDLCDDRGDTWEKVYEIQPTKDALVIVTPRSPLSLVETNGISVQTGSNTLVMEGSISYHAEIWKCSDYDWFNEVRYLGYKTGYGGSGDQWSYGDAHYEADVECYESAVADGGQLVCETWAKTPPTYVDLAATLTVADQDVAGTSEWEPVPSSAIMDLAWDGNFDGCLHAPFVCVPVHADLLALDQLATT